MRVAGAVAAGYCAFLSMIAAGWTLLGKAALGDWVGYQAMYDRGGGYLASQRRDPLFGWIIDRAFDVFGGGSYEIFRIALFALFTLLAAFVAFSGVIEGSLFLASVLVSIDAFFLKSIVQIREGLAFVAILLPIVLISSRETEGVIITVGGSLAALFIHVGTSAFLIVCVVAFGVRLLPVGPSSVRLLPRWLTSFAVVSGVIAVTLINKNIEILEHWLHQLGINENEAVTGGVWKYLYWIGMGVVVTIVRAQVVNSNRELKDFRSAYALTLGAGLLPLLYVICAITVVMQFKLASVAAMQIRMFLTAIELSLIIVVVRGRANIITGLIAAVTLMDQMRLIFVI